MPYIIGRVARGTAKLAGVSRAEMVPREIGLISDPQRDLPRIAKNPELLLQ